MRELAQSLTSGRGKETFTELQKTCFRKAISKVEWSPDSTLQHSRGHAIRSQANRNRCEDLLMASPSSEMRKGRILWSSCAESSWRDHLASLDVRQHDYPQPWSRTIKLITTSSMRTLRLSADTFLCQSSTKYGSPSRTIRKEIFWVNKATVLRLLYELDSTCSLLNLVMIAMAPCHVVVVKPLVIIIPGEPFFSPSSSWFPASVYDTNN